jgi:hypothetical protein
MYANSIQCYIIDNNNANHLLTVVNLAVPGVIHKVFVSLRERIFSVLTSSRRKSTSSLEGEVVNVADGNMINNKMNEKKEEIVWRFQLHLFYSFYAIYIADMFTTIIYHNIFNNN